jgi:hypothetical protein
MEPQGGDLFWIEVETEVVANIADDPRQAVTPSFEPFAVVGIQQEPARRLREMLATRDPVAGMTDAGIEMQPDHRIGSGEGCIQIVASEMLDLLIGQHREAGDQTMEGSVIPGLNNGLGKVGHGRGT